MKFFRVPESIAKLLGTNRAHSPKVLLPFSVFYLALEGLGAIVGPPTSSYDFPLLSILWQIGIWSVVLPFGYLVHRNPTQKYLALKNLAIWFLASLCSVIMSADAVFLITHEPIPEDLSASYLRVAASGFVNLAAYLMIISAVFDYREIASVLRRELGRLEVVRETIASNLAALKASYLEEVQGKIAPVLDEIQASLQQADPDAVMGQARSAINDLVLPMSATIANGALPEAMRALPDLPSDRLRVRLRQIFDVKVDLRDSFMPLVVTVIFIASFLSAYTYFYKDQGLAAAAVALAEILAGHFLLSLLFRRRQLSIFPSVAIIFVAASLTAVFTMFSINFVVQNTDSEASAFLAFGNWLLVFLAAFLQMLNSLTGSYLQKLSAVQNDFARTLQNRDFEIRQLKNRLTTAIHNDVQGKLRAVLLRVRKGGLSPENLVLLEADLAHLRTALAEIDSKQESDFYARYRALQEFWSGVCQIKLRDDLDVAELLEIDEQVSAKTFELVSEAVANAVKHAEAELIEVHLSIDSKQLVISVANSLDKGLVSNPSSGVGSRLFGELSDGWKVRQDDSRYEVTILLNLV